MRAQADEQTGEPAAIERGATAPEGCEGADDLGEEKEEVDKPETPTDASDATGPVAKGPQPVEHEHKHEHVDDDVDAVQYVNTMEIKGGEIPDGSVDCAAVYFLRCCAGKVPVGAAGDTSPIVDAIEFGIMSEGASLNLLENLLSGLYLPLLSGNTMQNTGGRSVLSEGARSDTVRNELLGNVQKFAAQVKHAIQQLTGDIHLTIPSITIDNPEEATDNVDVINQLEAAMANWTTVLASAIQRESDKVPVGKGPLAEIMFWRERNAALSSLFEELNLPHVKNMIALLDQGSQDAKLLQPFKFQIGELPKLYVEAKDNVKFLTTLERHFKSISSGTLTSVLDTLPPMMNALRMVWIISRHYADDTRMWNLFERIANELADNVADEIDVGVLFSLPPGDAIELIDLAKNVLEQWSDVYMQVRLKIEMSGRDARWEFD